MTADMAHSKWRNFASWSVAGAGVTAVAMALATWAKRGDPSAAFVHAGAIDLRILAVVAVTALLVGVTGMGRPLGWRRFGRFVASSAVAGVIALVVLTRIRPLAEAGAFGPMGASQWAAAGLGLMLLLIAVMVALTLTAMRGGWSLLDPDQAEMLRERGRLSLLALGSVSAMGAMLVLMSIAGPGSIVPRGAALAGLVALGALSAWLSRASWRAMDELDHTLSRESGNLGFYLVMLFGGGWAMLAELGYVGAPQPIDWVTMLVAILFAASIAVVARRRLFRG